MRLPLYTYTVYLHKAQWHDALKLSDNPPTPWKVEYGPLPYEENTFSGWKVILTAEESDFDKESKAKSSIESFLRKEKMYAAYVKKAEHN